MTVVYILLGILLLLLLLPVSARYCFDGEGHLTVRYAGIPLYTYSSKTEKEAEKTAKKRTAKQGKKTKSQKENPVKRLTAQLKEDGVAGVLTFLQEVIQLAGGTFRRLFRILRFGKCSIGIVLGSGEAADKAVRYGKLAGPIYSTRSLLLSLLHIRRLELDMHPDFLAEKDTVTADVRLHTGLLPLLWLVLCTGFSGIGMLQRYSNTQSEDGRNGKEGQ